MKFTKTQFLAIGLFLVLLVSLPVAVFLSQNRQDIRPRADAPTPTITPSQNVCTASTLPMAVTQNITAVTTATDYKGMQVYFRGKSTSDAVVNYSDIYGFYQSSQWYVENFTGASAYLVVTFSANGTGQVATYPAGSMSVTIDGVEKILKFPSFTLTSQGSMISFYVAADGSTYYANSAHAEGSVTSGLMLNILNSTIDLTPTNAFATAHEAFCTGTLTPTVSITPSPTGVSLSCLALPQSDNFDTGPNPGPLWNNWINNGVVTVGGTLNGNVASGNGYAGVITQNKVCGDFDVRVDFSGFTSSGQSEADARLSVEEDVGNLTVVPSTFFIERYSKGNEQGFKAAMVINGGSEQTASPAASFATSGKLRIRRVGSVFTTYYDVGSGWQTLGVFASGFTSDVHPAIIVKSWDQNPSVSASFDNFNLTSAILDPSITPIPPTITLTPIPTPPSGRDKYLIDVGDKQSLVINIGAAIAPQIKFKAKLASVRSTPDMYLKLRVKDELAFMDRQNDASAAASSCNNPVLPDKDFYIPVKADANGVYSPVQQITTPAPGGASVAVVSAEGWVMLDGVVPGRYYTLYLKGPKTRKSRMLEHFNLQPNQTGTQDYDWTGKPLDPGDLPDPGNSNQQDCTINSADWSLVMGRIGSNQTDSAALGVADVNYTGDVNALDSIAILDTLKLRPDDDN